LASDKSVQGVSLAQLEAKGSEELIDLVLIHVSNREVEELFAKLEDLQSYSELSEFTISQNS